MLAWLSCSGNLGGLFGVMKGVGLPVPGSPQFFIAQIFTRLSGAARLELVIHALCKEQACMEAWHMIAAA